MSAAVPGSSDYPEVPSGAPAEPDYRPLSPMAGKEREFISFLIDGLFLLILNLVLFIIMYFY